jgi:very-short-patch-repair endonuclease
MGQATEANSTPLKWAIEQARKELVDPSRRNRLLHAPLSGKRPWCLAVSGHSADVVFNRLYWQETFRGFAFAPKPDVEGDVSLLEASKPVSLGEVNGEGVVLSPRKSSSAPHLQTKLDAGKLEKRLTKIFREERTLEEEQGISTLFLAIGFLKWSESEQSEEASYAPLILVPVSLIRARGKEGFLLTGRDDEIVVNVSLLEKLRSEFSVSLPNLPESEEWKPSDYFDAVEREIHRYKKWAVERESIGLGFFTFSKFLMWRDLDASTWPNGGLLSHPLLDVLIGAGGDFETLPPLVPDDEAIDPTIDISKTIHVVDADSSQTIVIEEATKGSNLVVQGPPGTGKSQTITNIIAAAVHSGKTVLFIAEKAAALAVVQERLLRAGLGALCLSMHSKKANKRDVLKALDDALRFQTSLRTDAEAADRLANCRDQLNKWSKLLHGPIERTGQTPYEIIGTHLRLRAGNIELLPIQLDQVADWSKEEIDLALEALGHACYAIAKLESVPSAHAWFGTNLQSQSPFDIARLTTTLQEAIQKIDVLQSRVAAIHAKIVVQGKPCLADAAALVRAFRHLASAPAGRAALENALWNQNLEAIVKAVDQGEELAHLVAQIDSEFQREAWRTDTTILLTSLRADGPSFFRRLGKRYRQATADLRAICRAQPPRSLALRIAMIERLRDAQTAYREFSKIKNYLVPILGALWADLNSNWTAARGVATWLAQARSHIGANQIIALAAKSADVSTFAAYADALDGVSVEASKAVERVCQAIQPDPEHFSKDYFESVPLADLRDQAANWLKYIEKTNDWVHARRGLDQLRQCGLDVLANGLMNGRLHPARVRAEAELLISEALWKRAVQVNPEIASIEGSVRSESIDDFRIFDHRRIRSARQEVLTQYIARKPTGHIGEMSIVRGEIEKKRGHRSLRKLIVDAGSAVQKLKPVFLMSPLSVAQFLPPGRLAFDLLVIDEASQVAPEDALGVVARANQIVVVGDHRQLPPTNFFKMVNAGSEDQEEEDEGELGAATNRPSDYESILTLARTRGMSERMLAWHYRSKHPSLIALSNDECYGGRLLLPPSPFVQTKDFGLGLVKTPRGFYDRGGTSRDLVQAEMVAKAVRDHIINLPNKSLGVACLSVQQREAVYDMIDKLGIRGDVEAFAPKDERLFVKNLEAVQGDERDVIFISVGYGVAPNQSRPFLNFGPVSRDGGERRLNVLASRAREKCVIFSSITAADIPADTEVRGTRMLRSLLHFAETGKLGAGSFRGGDFDSPFEEAVARVIREAGFHVHSQVGVSSFRIDLGVINPTRPGEYLMGVECDGATYHSARSARDRDRLRQEVLESLGWRLYRIWSTDWFRNPVGEADKLLAAAKDADIARSKLQTANGADQSEEQAPDNAAITAAQINEDAAEEPMNGFPSELAYRECSIAVPFRRGLLDLSPSELSRLSLNVIEAEGPIHTDEVARRLREAFGLQKTGNRILNHVRESLRYLDRAGLAVRDGDFWTVRGREAIPVRSRRNASLPLRRAIMIAPSEYKAAVISVLEEAISISPDQLAVETARRFGFDRTGQDLKQEIDRQMNALIDAGEIVRDGGVLRSCVVANR